MASRASWVLLFSGCTCEAALVESVPVSGEHRGNSLVSLGLQEFASGLLAGRLEGICPTLATGVVG